MPLPPLSADERRLGTFALVSAWLYAASGLFFAFLPGLTLRLAADNQPLTFGPGARLWHTLSISMMAMLAVCCWLTSRSPRDNRTLLIPVLLSKVVSTVGAAIGLLAWHAVDPESSAGRRTLLSTIGTDFPLFLATAWYFWKAAPGVRAEAQAERLDKPEGPKPVALGLARAKAPADAVGTPQAIAANAKPPG